MFPYRWLPSTFFANISWFFYSIRRGVKNIIRWTPIIWGDEDFDWEYLAKIMETKMRWMSKHIKKYDRVVDGGEIAKELLICAELLKRLTDDNMDDMVMNGANVLRHERRMKGWRLMLGRLIGKKLRCWWT